MTQDDDQSFLDIDNTQASHAHKLAQEQTNSAHFKKMEELQLQIQKQPESMVFIQLADLYLTKGMIAEARELVDKSIKIHPHSTSGLILKGRISKHERNYSEAIDIFSMALKRAPSNWYALLLRGETYIKFNQPKKALADFKMVMLHNPQHPFARKAVAKLEILTADEYDEDVFELKKISDLNDGQTRAGEPISQVREGEEVVKQWRALPVSLERVLALVDAFTVRHDYKKAIDLIKDCRKEFPEYSDHGEVNLRLLRLKPFESAQIIRPKLQSDRSALAADAVQQKKLAVLQSLLHRIEKSKKIQFA